MTREEAIKMAKAKLKCLEHATSPYDVCLAYDCDNCSLLYEQGNMGEQKEWLKIAIEDMEKVNNENRRL